MEQARGVMRVSSNGKRKRTGTVRDDPLITQSEPPALRKSEDSAVQSVRAALPITPHAKLITSALAKRAVLLLVGETGSGKSTQIPQLLLSSPWCTRTIAITQPRRVAAISLARRVAAEMGTSIGGDEGAVGYSVRFDVAVGPRTRIKFLTEGMLLQELMRDPWLRAYSAVVVDEVHERSVNVDLILGFLRRNVCSRESKVKRSGEGLKVVVMSATADIDALFRFWADGFGENLHVSAKDGEFGLVRNLFPESVGDTASEKAMEEWDGIRSSEDERMRDNPEVNNQRKTKESASNNPLLRGYANDKANRDDSKARRNSSVGGSKAFQEGVGSTKATPTSTPVSSRHDLPASKNISFVHIPGRLHAVRTFYLDAPTSDFIESALSTIFKIHTKEPLPGDILVFLTGQDSVESLEALVREYASQLDHSLPSLMPLPLFAALPRQQQDLVFQPAPAPFTRKVILATNIAETSVTIPGIRHVVDAGLHKIKEYRSALALDTLLVKPISKSSAIQRKGRAGREGSGTCYRLYTEKTYLELEDRERPEILRCDLASAVLTLKARKVDDVLSFPFLETPSRDSMKKALLALLQLAALREADGKISEVGRQMARMPLSPALSRVLIAAAAPKAGVLLEVIDIIASLTVESVFLAITTEEKKEEAAEARSKLLRREGDHMTLLAAVRGYSRAGKNERERRVWAERHFISWRAMQNVMNVRRQLRGLCISQKLLSNEHSLSSNGRGDASRRGEVGGVRASGSGSGKRSGMAHSKRAAAGAPAAQEEHNMDHGYDLGLNPDEYEDSEGSNDDGQMVWAPERAEIILKSFLSGFSTNTARLMPDGSYRTLEGNQTVAIHPGSVLFGRKVEAIMYNEFVFTSKSYARGVSAVQLDWCEEAAVPRRQ